MNLHRLAQQRAAGGRPVKVGLIGAGKFGSMFLAQVPTMAGIEVRVIADLDLERARAACHTVGWNAAQLAKTAFVDSGARPARIPKSRLSSKRRGCRPRASSTLAQRLPRKNTSSWSMLKPMC
jgi:predicted homoserine dehydrogenase-like protein